MSDDDRTTIICELNNHINSVHKWRISMKHSERKHTRQPIRFALAAVPRKQWSTIWKCD